MKLTRNIEKFIQRGMMGYCDEDLYNIDCWFIKIFPNMLDNFAECTIGHPCNEKEILEEINNFPIMWCDSQKGKIKKIFKKHRSTEKLELTNPIYCWTLIILRMAYCFRMCDEWNEEYNEFDEERKYEEKCELIEKYKKEAFYLFEKYFFNLWW